MEASEGQPRKSWGGRDDRFRLEGLPERALASDPGTTADGEVSVPTRTPGGNRKAGRRGAEARHSNGGRSVHSAGGDAGAAKPLGPDVLRQQLWIPAGTVGTSSGGTGAAIYRRGIHVCSGPGSGEILRFDSARQAFGLRAHASVGPECAQADPDVAGDPSR